MEMILEPGQEIERLQAIDTQCLEEVVVGRELFTTYFEMLRGEIENFFQGLFLRFHSQKSVYRSSMAASYEL